LFKLKKLSVYFLITLYVECGIFGLVLRCLLKYNFDSICTFHTEYCANVILLSLVHNHSPHLNMNLHICHSCIALQYFTFGTGTVPLKRSEIYWQHFSYQF